MNNEFDFFKNYQSFLLKNSDTDNLADKQRKSIAQMYNASCLSLSNENTSFLLENKLKEYSSTMSTSENYESRLDNIFSKAGIKRPEFKSNIDKIDIKSLLNQLPCSNDKYLSAPTCSECENASNVEFKQFLEAFKPENEELPRKISKTLSNSEEKENTHQLPKNQLNCFRTARDELQAQNSKKYGNSSNNQQGNVVAQRKKLGFRRNINSKFVSPLLSNENKEETEEKNEKIPVEEDERLKHIDPKMVELIKSEIMAVSASVTWDDIAGLKFAKTAIQEAVVWPMLRPDIFTGLRRPPKGILLFGPPGTGKTLIGKCVASQSRSTFFSISASSLTSKWIGDGEKMVRALFSVARVHQPAVIFIDEIDSLLSQRSDSEHESSRRIKTEFLVQLDGATTDNEERILVIGATNRPQELDEAARRRLVKRLYIPLPEFDARLQLIKKLISKERHSLTEDDFMEIARLCDGYSGADIRNLCSEASLGPLRSIDSKLIEKIQASEVRSLLMEDFENAFKTVRSSVSPKDLDQYVAWDQTYGSGNGF